MVGRISLTMGKTVLMIGKTVMMGRIPHEGQNGNNERQKALMMGRTDLVMHTVALMMGGMALMRGKTAL